MLLGMEDDNGEEEMKDNNNDNEIGGVGSRSDNKAGTEVGFDKEHNNVKNDIHGSQGSKMHGNSNGEWNEDMNMHWVEEVSHPNVEDWESVGCNSDHDDECEDIRSKLAPCISYISYMHTLQNTSKHYKNHIKAYCVR